MYPSMIGIFGLGLMSQVAFAQGDIASHSSWAASKAITDERYAISYATPSESAQAIALGRYGHQSSGPRINDVRAPIQLAAEDHENGDVNSTEQRAERDGPLYPLGAFYKSAHEKWHEKDPSAPPSEENGKTSYSPKRTIQKANPNR